LAVVFALERLHQFTYSSLIVACSDHNLLEAITRKPLDREPKRLQGMLLCAPAYDIEVEYLEGKKSFLPINFVVFSFPLKETTRQVNLKQ
jgi:hypothetical protein